MLSIDPRESADEAGLRYVTGSGPCIRRIRCGRSFRYVAPDGKPLRDPRRLERIRSLVIPPAWKNVWICPSPNGHIQAVGWDARGRKQYRYHPQYREVRDEAKFSRLIAFGTVLATARSRVEKDLKRRGLPKEKVLAAVFQLLQSTFIRVGNDEYAKENESFRLTTLRNEHVGVSGAKMRFHFRGKSGKDHAVELTDGRLAKIVKQCQELPGQELFQYVNDDGVVCHVDSADVNRYLRRITRQDFSAKDFRTWAGTVLGARELYDAGPSTSESDGKRKIVAAVKRVAERLGNCPATCRKYYIHPAIVEGYSEGLLFPVMERGVEQNTAYSGLGLAAEEYAVMVMVAEYQQRRSDGAAPPLAARARSAA
jgi:DNA topoisomerase-1